MEDFGEYTPLDVRTADGRDGGATHNRYPTDYHCAAYAATSRHPLVRFQRSGWTGAARCAQVVWSGDPTTSWDFDGLVRAGTVLALLPPDVDTLADYGAGAPGLVRLADRARSLRLLAFPRGTSEGRFGKKGRYSSVEARGKWTLIARAERRSTVMLQASMRTLQAPFEPCSVLVNRRPLPDGAWSFESEYRRAAGDHRGPERPRRGRGVHFVGGAGARVVVARSRRRNRWLGPVARPPAATTRRMFRFQALPRRAGLGRFRSAWRWPLP